MATLHCTCVLSQVLLAVDLIYQIYSLACGEIHSASGRNSHSGEKNGISFFFFGSECMLTNYLVLCSKHFKHMGPGNNSGVGRCRATVAVMIEGIALCIDQPQVPSI
jgi:hypothetical protein